MTTLKNPMTMEELLNLPVSFDLPTAARALGIGRNKAYEMAAAAGELTDGGVLPCPVRRLRNEYRVTRPDLFRALGLPPDLIARPAALINPDAGAASTAPGADPDTDGRSHSWRTPKRRIGGDPPTAHAGARGKGTKRTGQALENIKLGRQRRRERERAPQSEETGDMTP